MIRVFIPTQLQSYCPGTSHVEARGSNVDEVLHDLDRRFPGIRFRIVVEQDRIRRHMRIFIGETAAREVSAVVGDDDELLIFGALSGG